MSEGSGALWKYVRGKLLPPGVHATRIENEGGEAGFPDVHYTYQGRTGTLELKFLRKKNPPFGDDGLRVSQRIWIRDELEAGGRVWIIADLGKTIHLVNGLFYNRFNDWVASDFKARSNWIGAKRAITESDLAKFAGFL